jgi:hypothetical protein
LAPEGGWHPPRDSSDLGILSSLILIKRGCQPPYALQHRKRGHDPRLRVSHPACAQARRPAKPEFRALGRYASITGIHASPFPPHVTEKENAKAPTSLVSLEPEARSLDDRPSYL